MFFHSFKKYYFLALQTNEYHQVFYCLYFVKNYIFTKILLRLLIITFLSLLP